LHPGGSAGDRSITIERLQPGRRYAVRGATVAEVVADANGQARCTVALHGRTEVAFAPS